jgi:hypothetical protein
MSRVRLIQPVWILPVIALLLGCAVIVRSVHGHGDDARNTRHATDGRRAQGDAPIAYEPGRVDVPAGWSIVDRRGNVTTWSEPSKDDAVTVASVESSAAPLAAVVADVAASSRRLDSSVDVAAPHELAITHGARGDSAILLAMTLRDPRGTPLHVRQIWRRDARAARDVVATWTSRDERWPSSPEHGIPEVDVR